MAAVSIEMRSLMEGGSSTEQIDEARLYIRNLPSHVARHTTSTVMRNQVTTRRKSRGTSVKRSGALRRQGKRDDTPTTAWSSDGDQEPTAGPISSTDEEVLENVDFKAVPLPMSLRRRYKQSLRARAPRRVSGWKVFILNVAMGWKHFQTGLKECIYSLELWRGHLKDIEGQFGSGVVSYFVFLRWLMFLNLFVFLIEFGFVSLPTLLICTDAGGDSAINVTSCKYEVNYAAKNGSDNSTGNSFSTMVLDFITGQGWISNTIMFYSSYPSDAIVSQEGVRYHLPLAYLLTGGAYFLFCLVIMIHSASIGLKESYINSEGVFNSSCNRLFSAWDYCISEKSAAMHKKQMIVQDIRFELEEEARLLRVQKRSRKQKMVLYGTRTVINLFIVPALWYVSFVLVVGVIIGKKVTEEGRSKVEQMLIR